MRDGNFAPRPASDEGLSLLCFRSDYEGWKQKLCENLSFKFVNDVLEVTMRDGNMNCAAAFPIMPAKSFRSDYEGWKLRNKIQNLLPQHF